jgi:hypothetical protein
LEDLFSSSGAYYKDKYKMVNLSMKKEDADRFEEYRIENKEQKFGFWDVITWILTAIVILFATLYPLTELY